MGYERWLIHKQPRQDLDLCGYSFARYWEKCLNTLVWRRRAHPDGHQHGGRKATKTFVMSSSFAIEKKFYYSRAPKHRNL